MSRLVLLAAMVDKLQKRVCMAVFPSLAVSLEAFAHR